MSRAARPGNASPGEARIRVLVVQEYIAAYRQGFYRELQRAAVQHGVDLRVAAGRPQGRHAARGDMTFAVKTLPVRQIEFHIGHRRLVLRDWIRYLRGVDVIVLEQARRNLDIYVLLALPKIVRRASVVLWGHGKDYVLSAGITDRAVLGWLTRRSDWVLTYTPEGTNAVKYQVGHSKQVTTLYNSVDTETLLADLEAVTDEQLAHFVSEHSLTTHTVCFIGGLDESKRLDFLSSAMDGAHEGDASLRLIIAGGGVEKAAIERWARTRPWVTVFGPVQGQMKASILRASSAIVMPGRVGLVAVESLVTGRPIITTEWAHHAPEFEYLDDSTSVVAKNTSESYGEAVIELLRDEKRLQILSDACREKGSIFSSSAMAERFMHGVISAAKAKRSTRP